MISTARKGRAHMLAVEETTGTCFLVEIETPPAYAHPKHLVRAVASAEQSARYQLERLVKLTGSTRKRCASVIS